MKNIEIISDILDSYEMEYGIWWEEKRDSISYPSQYVDQHILGIPRIICNIKNIDNSLIKDLNDLLNLSSGQWLSMYQKTPILKNCNIILHSRQSRQYFNSLSLMEEVLKVKFIERIRFLTDLNLILLTQYRWDDNFSKCTNLKLEFNE